MFSLGDKVYVIGYEGEIFHIVGRDVDVTYKKGQKIETFTYKVTPQDRHGFMKVNGNMLVPFEWHYDEYLDRYNDYLFLAEFFNDETYKEEAYKALDEMRRILNMKNKIHISS